MLYYAGHLEAPMVSRAEGFRGVVAFAWTFALIYATEKLADYFFLTDNTADFYFMSGWRLIFFIMFALGGAVAAGALLRNVWWAVATQWAALGSALILFFYVCNPRVCFSTGLDGLESLRLGFFLASVSFSGAALGAAAHHRSVSPLVQLLGAFFGFTAVGFYPVIFTFAGTRLLPPFHPWASAAILAVVAFPVSVAVSLDFGSKRGVLVPLGGMGALLLISFGIAAAYLQSVLLDVVVLSIAVAAAALAGIGLTRKERKLALAQRSKISSLLAVGIALVLAMMLLTTPDAVNGITPASGSATAFVQGVPVYSGGAMEGPAGHAAGAGVTLSFEGTNASSIQGDNYLAAGIGIHSAGCCVDGIDYSYRYDLLLFHSGNESMVASAWEVCDDNAACGGHSWKLLLYSYARGLGRTNLGQNVTLTMTWLENAQGAGVRWSYGMSGQGDRNFTWFTTPSAENPNFNTGVLQGGNPPQKASYFFQFGMMSRYPIEDGGWRVTMWCPSLLGATWSCIKHAMTLDGGQSFWKIFWRWGEDYQGASVTSPIPGEVQFAHSSESTPSFQKLW
jgi:hypothetical protein